MTYAERDLVWSKGIVEVDLLSRVIASEALLEVEAIFLRGSRCWESFAVHVALDSSSDCGVVKVMRPQILILSQAIQAALQVPDDVSSCRHPSRV